MNLVYATELTLEQWELLHPLLLPAKTTGRPRSADLMQVMQAIFYVLMTGCAWRLLPKDIPPTQRSTTTSGNGVMALGVVALVSSSQC